MFDGELDGVQLLDALARAETLAPSSRPDLSRREWTKVGSDHAAAYREAVRMRHRPRRSLAASRGTS